MRALLYVAIGSLTLALAVALALGWQDRATLSATVVSPDAALNGPMAVSLPPSFVGVLFPRQEVDLVATVQARVVTLPVQLGTRLAAGDVVATLDAASIRRELDAATAAVRAAQADVAAAKVERASAASTAARVAKLADSVSEEERANARYQEKLAAAREDATRARLGEAVARVDQLRVLLERTAIVAPFAGRIAARHVDSGALVGPDRPVARLISDELWARFAVPELQVGMVRHGGCIRAAVRSPELMIDGVIENVSPEIDTALRMVFVEARVEIPPAVARTLPAGLPVRITIVPCSR